MLNRTLNACRAVGMTDEMASEWILSALDDLAHLSDGEFESGCRNARQTCSHHGQILPAILNNEVTKYRAALDSKYSGFLNDHRPKKSVAALGGSAQKLIEGAARDCQP